MASQAQSAAYLNAHAAARAAAGYVPKNIGNTNAKSHAMPITPSIIRTNNNTVLNPSTALPPKIVSSMAITVASSSTSSLSSPPLNDGNHQNDELLWKLDINGVKSWVQRIHALFPKSPKPRLDVSGQPLQAGSIRGGTLRFLSTMNACFM